MNRFEKRLASIELRLSQIEIMLNLINSKISKPEIEESDDDGPDFDFTDPHHMNRTDFEEEAFDYGAF